MNTTRTVMQGRRGPDAPRRLTRRASAGALAAVIALGALPLAATSASAKLGGVGPVSTTNGYPTYFQDSNGLKLRLCDDIDAGCALAERPDETAPLSFPGNYPGESFYFAAETRVRSGKVEARYRAALEAAFTGEDAEAGENIVFARVRVRVSAGLVPGATYKVIHPYGELTLKATSKGALNYTDDRGCMAPPCGTFQRAADSFLGDGVVVPRSEPVDFLTARTFNRAARAGTPIGDPDAELAVKGSPRGTNYFEIVGPKVGGGTLTLRSNTFALEGQVAG